MPSIQRTARVFYRPDQMFDLVNDIARYPEFIPGCVGARVAPVAENELIATLDIAKGMLKTQLRTRNRSRLNSAIEMRLEEGPLRALDAEWNFSDISGVGTRVDFRMSFELERSLIGAALSPVFEKLCRTMVDVFVERARVIYE